MEARYYHKTKERAVQCNLCPHNCIIKNDKSGVCKVRTNHQGTLITNNYGLVSSLGFDPIEKKPLYHFYPGKEILSVGSLGCNLKCEFCQNWQISQTSVEDFTRGAEHMKVDELIKIALSNKHNIGIAYTYNEPTVFFEYMIDIAKKAKENKLKNVMVTNGFINKEPLNELNQYIDAYNVDLKAFNESFYLKYTHSMLDPVKESLLNIKKAGKHLEITNLIIPDLNDNQEEFLQMVKWIRNYLGKQTVLHISRYYPTYKLKKESTSIDKMLELYKIATHYLDFVFLGNVNLSEGNHTYCPNCGELLISRRGYVTNKQSVSKDGNCLSCGMHLFEFLN